VSGEFAAKVERLRAAADEYWRLWWELERWKKGVYARLPFPKLPFLLHEKGIRFDVEGELPPPLSRLAGGARRFRGAWAVAGRYYGRDYVRIGLDAPPIGGELASRVPVFSLMVAALVYRLLKRHGIDILAQIEKELEKPGLFGGEMRGILDLIAELVEVECDG